MQNVLRAISCSSVLIALATPLLAQTSEEPSLRLRDSARNAATQKSLLPWILLTRPPTPRGFRRRRSTAPRVSAVHNVTGVVLSRHTTLRLGGPATRVVTATHQDELAEFIRASADR